MFNFLIFQIHVIKLSHTAVTYEIGTTHVSSKPLSVCSTLESLIMTLNQEESMKEIMASI